LIAARQLRERGRQRDAHFESGWRVAHFDGAALAFGDTGHDGEAEAAAWGVVIGEGSS
jgi:hypothetical protein